MFTKFHSLATRLAIAGQAHQPSPAEKRAIALLCVLALSSQVAFAADVHGALTEFQTKMIGFVQIIVAIGLTGYLGVVVFKFMQKSPDAPGHLMYLIVAVALWFGFQIFKDEIVTAVAGSSDAGGGVR